MLKKNVFFFSVVLCISFCIRKYNGRTFTYVVYLVDISAVFLVDIVVFCRIAVCTACRSLKFFIILSPRLPVTHNICLQFDI